MIWEYKRNTFNKIAIEVVMEAVNEVFVFFMN